MIEAAGLGVAYHAKPKTRAAAGAAVSYGDLNSVAIAAYSSAEGSLLWA